MIWKKWTQTTLPHLNSLSSSLYLCGSNTLSSHRRLFLFIIILIQFEWFFFLILLFAIFSLLRFFFLSIRLCTTQSVRRFQQMLDAYRKKDREKILFTGWNQNEDIICMASHFTRPSDRHIHHTHSDRMRYQ